MERVPLVRHPWHTSSPFDLSAKECHKPDPVYQTTSPLKCSSSPKYKREQAEKDFTLCMHNGYTECFFFQFGLAIHQNDHQARRRFIEWAQNEIVVVPDFHKRILFSDEAHFWLNGYVNKQNCRIWSEANPQVYV
ncbi:hypothetical protein TNCV_4177931 [Trichonephila clavipes]|nr:hypothetical protein TNCV_4177931 [Trichonephila clavipes]